MKSGNEAGFGAGKRRYLVPFESREMRRIIVTNEIVLAICPGRARSRGGGTHLRSDYHELGDPRS